MGDLSANFNRSEFRCKCGKCGLDTIDHATLEVLEAVRAHFGAPVTVNSGHRCFAYNRSVGGASDSQHLYGRAADITVKGVTPATVADFIENVLLKNKGGVGRYKTFTHVDTRTNGSARWVG